MTDTTHHQPVIDDLLSNENHSLHENTVDILPAATMSAMSSGHHHPEKSHDSSIKLTSHDTASHDSDDTIPHADNPLLQQEHMQLMNLVVMPSENRPGDDVFVAINDGSWFDANTWEHGEIPTNGARVFIPSGVHVHYDQKSNARIYTLRVDGSLEFAKDQNTKLLVDTFLVSPTGHLEIGSESEAVHADVKTQIIFTSDTAIDTNWDTQQLSRGLLSHGQVSIYGADKQDFVRLTGNAKAGDSYLEIEGTGAPLGWKVGDQLVLGGTYYSDRGSDADNSRFHDEELTITRIVGNRVFFSNNDSGDNQLRFDHQVPAGHESSDLGLYVANLTRNVSFSTENGKNVPISHRGHVMFMHNPNVVVENAGFYDLGRTDKLKLIDAVGTNVDGSEGTGTNVRGRYAVHFHRTGGDDWAGKPAIARGNAISGSPGWGLVHHASYAIFEDNVVFDVVGAGIAAEAGNEIGAWHNNLTLKTTGNGDATIFLEVPERFQQHDFGYEGEGYWVQGAAQIAMLDNKAVSAAGGGINIFGDAISGGNFREVEKISVDVLSPEMQSIAKAMNLTEIDVANIPLLQLSGFEAYNASTGMFFWVHMPNNDGQHGFNGPNVDPAHELRSRVDNFKLWNIISNGVHFQYTTQVDLENGLILGNPLGQRGSGISSNRPPQKLGFKNLHIEGFVDGLYVPREGDIGESVPFLGSKIEDSTFVNNQNHLSNRLSRQREASLTNLYPDYFEIINTSFSDQPNNQAPIAAFSSKVVGGLGLSFDASASYDPDVPESNGESMLAIAAYGWDFDNDGIIDKFGRSVSHKFDTAGAQRVSLTVWDSQGASNTYIETIQVQPSAFSDGIQDGTFANTKADDLIVNTKYHGSIGFNQGWISPGWTIDSSIGDGVAVAVNPLQGLGQVIYDDYLRTGLQNLTLDLLNVEGDDQSNSISVRVWGINGQFSQTNFTGTPPSNVGAIPMESELLLAQTVGGSPYNWKTFQWQVDFNQGYEFILVQFNADGFNQRTDTIALDNVKIFSNGKELGTPNPPKQDETPQDPGDTNNSSNGSQHTREDQYVVGSMTQDSLSGGLGNDKLVGLGGRDYLTGYGGNDNLRGGGSNDTLMGGDGNDILHGNYGADRMEANAGRDLLIAGHGNDFVQGGAGADQIIGGQGMDTLEGGSGSDRLRWTSLRDFGDTVIKFDHSEDRLQFTQRMFGGDLEKGWIESSQFILGSQALDRGDRFIYNKSTGQLFFDPDGTGSAAKSLVATFTNKTVLSAQVIQII